MIDNKKAAAIANGKEIQLPIVAGQHIIQMGGAFLKPKPIEINLLAGDTKMFECGINPKYTSKVIIGLLIIAALVYFVFYINIASFEIRMGIAILYYAIMIFINIRFKERRTYIIWWKNKWDVR